MSPSSSIRVTVDYWASFLEDDVQHEDCIITYVTVRCVFSGQDIRQRALSKVFAEHFDRQRNHL